MTVRTNQWQIGVVGYGEVGRILAEDLRKQDLRVSAYDVKLGNNLAGALREIRKTSGNKSLWRWFRETRESELIVVTGEDVAALAHSRRAWP